MLQANPLDRPLLPFCFGWGALHLGNLVGGVLYPAMLESGASSTVAISQIRMPNRGGLIRAMTGIHRSGGLPGVGVTYTVHIAGVATALTITIPAGSAVPQQSIVDVPFAPSAAPLSIDVRYACTAAPGTTSIRPAILVYGLLNL